MDIYVPIVPAPPAQENRQAFELARAQYQRGLEQYLRADFTAALLTLTSVFHDLKESEDQACLHLVMYSLMLACEAKLRLGQLNTCTTLCTFLIGKAAGVETLRTVLARLLHIRQQAYAAQGRQPVLQFDIGPGPGDNGPPVNMVNDVLAQDERDNLQLGRLRQLVDAADDAANAENMHDDAFGDAGLEDVFAAPRLPLLGRPNVFLWQAPMAQQLAMLPQPLGGPMRGNYGVVDDMDDDDASDADDSDFYWVSTATMMAS